MTSTATALRAGLLLSRRLDNDVVLEDGRAEDGHVAPPLVELSHLESLFEDGAALVNVLRVKNLQGTILSMVLTCYRSKSHNQGEVWQIT